MDMDGSVSSSQQVPLGPTTLAIPWMTANSPVGSPGIAPLHGVLPTTQPIFPNPFYSGVFTSRISTSISRGHVPDILSSVHCTSAAPDVWRGVLHGASTHTYGFCSFHSLLPFWHMPQLAPLRISAIFARPTDRHGPTGSWLTAFVRMVLRFLQRPPFVIVLLEGHVQ